MKWKLLRDKGFRVGSSTFECSAGYIVSVEQEDNKHQKLLVRFGDRIDWFHKSILKDFEKLDKPNDRLKH